MNKPNVRYDTDFKVTSEQIARLERSLLSVGKSGRASPEVVEAIKAVQYKEVLRLRAELDTAMGFEEQACDLMVSLKGPSIQFGAAPAVAIVKVLSNLRAAMLSVTGYLTTGELPGRGRLPTTVTQPSEFQFAGTTGGSIRLKLNLPKPQTLFPAMETEYAEHSLQLILQTVEWTASLKGPEDLKERVRDERLIRLLLTQVQRVAPSPKGAIQRVEFSGRLADPDISYVLSRKSAARISYAFARTSGTRFWVEETGKLRAVDADTGVFHLRQRPNDQPSLRCNIPREIMAQAITFLAEDAWVVVTGSLYHGKTGSPSHLQVEEIYQTGNDQFSAYERA